MAHGRIAGRASRPARRPHRLGLVAARTCPGQLRMRVVPLRQLSRAGLPGESGTGSRVVVVDGGVPASDGERRRGLPGEQARRLCGGGSQPRGASARRRTRSATKRPCGRTPDGTTGEKSLPWGSEPLAPPHPLLVRLAGRVDAAWPRTCVLTQHDPTRRRGTLIVTTLLPNYP